LNNHLAKSNSQRTTVNGQLTTGGKSSALALLVPLRDAMNNLRHHPNQLEERIISFAASVVSLSSTLPRNPQGRHICDQILRSGTSAAANYAEARAAESRADFIHKLKIVSKELNETTVWLEIIAKSSRDFRGKGGKVSRDCRGKPRTLPDRFSFDTNRTGIPRPPL
jgi:four helix bundle protein